MINSADLVELARAMTRLQSRRPKQAALRRAVSTAYYALFHAMAKDASDKLVGTLGAERSDSAWTHVYRSLRHKDAKDACKKARSLGFPSGIIACADAFVSLQGERHKADYDPNYNLRRVDVLASIEAAEEAINRLLAESSKDRTAFAVQLLLKRYE